MATFKVNLLFAALFVISISNANGMRRFSNSYSAKNKVPFPASQGSSKHNIILLCGLAFSDYRNCTIVLESTVSEEPKTSFSCDINLTPVDARGELGLYNWIYFLGETKVILSSIEHRRIKGKKPMLRFTIVNMSDCKRTEGSLELKFAVKDSITSREAVLATYDDTFDAFYPCDIEHKYDCRVSFDKNGKQISDTVKFTNDSISHAIPVVLDDSTKKFMYYEILGQDYKLSEGSEKQIELNFDGKKLIKTTDSYSQLSSFSTAHELLSWCSYVGDIRVNCSQFNHQGDLLLQTVVELKDYKYGSYPMHNLRDGGFLIGYFYIQPNPKFDSRVNVIKIDNHGKEVASLRMPLLAGCYVKEIVKFLELSANEYCVIITCFNQKSSKQNLGLDIVSDCFYDYEMEQKM